MRDKIIEILNNKSALEKNEKLTIYEVKSIKMNFLRYRNRINSKIGQYTIMHMPNHQQN